MSNNLVVCNCANCESCNLDDFEFYCNAINKKRRRINLGCNLFKCRVEPYTTVAFTLKEETYE